MNQDTHPGQTPGAADCGQAGAQQAVRMADPCTVVIFGATGDLAKRRLLPALFNLSSRGALPDEFTVVGVGRKPMSDEAYREQVRQNLAEFSPIPLDGALWAWLAPRVFYAYETLGDLASYQSLRERLVALDGPVPVSRGYVFYLATPPAAMAEIVPQLGAVGVLEETSPRNWRRVILEKPFGHDFDSAQALNRQLRSNLAEPQIYRIDHYLGKETVQNLMALRFANGIFEPIWNRRYVDHVQITVAETVGMEGRGSYYDTSGALRDMVQNHMFQILALTAMEPPNSFRADAVRDERVKVLQAIHLCSRDEVMLSAVRGQYTAAESGGKAVSGYRSEPSVPTGSTTETYFAMKLLLENWRWAGVPFYLRTGKRLPTRVTEIAVQFRSAPLRLFRDSAVECLAPNLLVVRVQPDEGISLQFQAKVPGPQVRLGTVKMDFSYADHFGSAPNTGYETLLYDCMTGDQTLFHRADMVETGWSVVAPILDVVQQEPAALLHDYPAFTWGPSAADAMLKQDGRAWRRPAS
ncbi:MAG: glucose-6-phosphate dehydrogenase [Vicinamibacterales bacterium]|nr:glucose-6-phosphate dehydrogenase [Vicinamibacterales bacterium]